LHAPNDALRTEIVPVNRNIGIQDILQAADDYFEVTGRRISYEYVLMAGINDRPEHAEELAWLLRGRNAHVNLIPMNGVNELIMTAPRDPDTQQFLMILEECGITATVRKRKGADIDAACGQLFSCGTTGLTTSGSPFKDPMLHDSHEASSKGLTMSNPFAMPDSQSMPSMETRSAVRLKRVGVLSAGMISGVGGAVGGLLAGGILFLMSLTMMGVAQQGNMNGNDPTAAVLGMGVGAIIVMPIAYGIFGFIGGVIYAFIYNILSGMTGGLQMEFSRD
jgi:hypothetical protein